MANLLTINHDSGASCYEEQLTANLVGKCRTEELDGVKYLVAKISALNPGVLNGSRGPLLYTPEDTRKATPNWNDVPLVIYHPTDSQGNPISAHSDSVVKVGFTKNAQYAGKLTVEGWFDVEKTKSTDSRVYDALVNGTPMEVSTGLGTTNEEAPVGSKYLGQLYTHIARNHKPDHLAILPDQRGACSLNDGCGLHVNQKGNVENCGGKGGKPGPCKTSLEDEFDSGKSGLLMTPDRLISEHKTLESFKKIAEQHGLRIKEMSHPSGVGVHYVAKDKEGNWRGKFDPEATHNSEELLCTNCDASGECEECKKKRLKKVSDEAEVAAIGDGMTDNEMSHDDLRQKLNQLVNEKYGSPLPPVFGVPSPISPSNLWVMDVYDKDFVYQDGSKQYRLGYKTDLRNDTVTLSEDAPVEVTQRKTYVANEQREFLMQLNCGGKGGKPGPCRSEEDEEERQLDRLKEDIVKGRKQARLPAYTSEELHREAVEYRQNLREKRKQTHNVGLKSVVNTLRKEADMAGKLSAEDREKLVDGLVENSGFQAADTWEEEDREVLNAMSDEKLYSLAVAKQTLIDQQSVVNAVGKHVGKHNLEDLPAAVENAFKPFKKKTDDEDMEDESDDEEAEGETTNMDHSIRVPRQLTEAEFMKMAPPSIRQDLEYSRAIQNKEKQELIGTITANVSGDELDQAVNYLRTKPLAELRIIANVTSKTAAPEYDVNIRRSPNYGGMAVPSQSRMTTNKRPGEGPRPVTIPWGEISKQA